MNYVYAEWSLSTDTGEQKCKGPSSRSRCSAPRMLSLTTLLAKQKFPSVKKTPLSPGWIWGTLASCNRHKHFTPFFVTSNKQAFPVLCFHLRPLARCKADVAGCPSPGQLHGTRGGSFLGDLGWLSRISEIISISQFLEGILTLPNLQQLQIQQVTI